MRPASTSKTRSQEEEEEEEEPEFDSSGDDIGYSLYVKRIFAITSPPGGVHIFAWLASFRNFAPKPAIFSLTTPVRIYLWMAVSSGVALHQGQQK